MIFTILSSSMLICSSVSSNLLLIISSVFFFISVIVFFISFCFFFIYSNSLLQNSKFSGCSILGFCSWSVSLLKGGAEAQCVLRLVHAQ